MKPTPKDKSLEFINTEEILFDNIEEEQPGIVKHGAFPFWVPPENLSTICEPIYKAACIIAEKTTIKETAEYIEIKCPIGCDNFILSDEYIESEGKEYRGTMPPNLQNIINYAASTMSKEGKITNMKLLQSKKPSFFCTYSLKSCNPDNNLHCALSNHCAYCIPMVAKYIRYLREYFPEEEKKQRKIYKQNEWDTYKKLEELPFEIKNEELKKMETPTDILKIGKLLIDQYLTLPTVVPNDENNTYIVNINMPEKISALTEKNILTWPNLKKHVPGEENEELDKYCFGLQVKQNITTSFINSILHLPPEGTNFLTAVILLNYCLLQTGRYKDFYNRQLKRELEEDKIYKSLTDKQPEYNGTSYKGCVISEEQTEKKAVIRAIHRKLKKANPNLSPVICTLPLPLFLESFSSTAQIDGYNHNFGLQMKNRVKPNILYVLNNIDQIKYNKRNIESGSNNEARIYREGLRTMMRQQPNTYIMLDGNETEIEKFLKGGEQLKLLYGTDITKLKEYDEETSWKLFRNKETKVTKKEYIDNFHKNNNKLPFKNNAYVEFQNNYYKTHGKLADIAEIKKEQQKDFKESIDSIVGLNDIKEQVTRMRNYIIYENNAKKEGINFPPINRHMVFKGNPGTGKTTMARIMAHVFYEGNVVKSDKFTECSSSDLIGEYVGETGQKTERLIEKALDGILFIDEAYALQYEYEYGKDAIAAIVKAMEDHKDRLVVILAGYKNEMEELVNQNPGMKSRIGYTFDFPDYSEPELMEIFHRKSKKIGFTTSPEADEKILQLMKEGKKSTNFGNGRFVDKVLQEAIIEHAQDTSGNISKEFTVNDIPDYKKLFDFNEDSINPIGFKYKTQKK